jgi:hypothetical protein
VFAVVPGLQAGSLRRALLLGGFFGLVTYATYDLTNHATVKNWPWMVDVDACGHDVGRRSRHIGQLHRIPGRTLAKVTKGSPQPPVVVPSLRAMVGISPLFSESGFHTTIATHFLAPKDVNSKISCNQDAVQRVYT